jgi:hypothetical protein
VCCEQHNTYIIRDTKTPLWQAFKARAAREGRSLRWVLEQLITRYVDGRTALDDVSAASPPCETSAGTDGSADA